MPVTHREPLSFYVDKLNRREPFTSLLYGDGEMLVALGKRTGRIMAYGEVITPRMVTEMSDSLFDKSPDIIHGTDLWLINWREYPGGDVANIAEVGMAWEEYTAPLHIEWYDGVVWENAIRAGEFAPCFQALADRQVCLVSHYRIAEHGLIDWRSFVPIPERNAYEKIDDTERTIFNCVHYDDPVFVICVGLGAIPLIMRLRKYFPQGTFLDLGSTFDVFVKMGGDRGWRNELYQNEAAWKDLVGRNLLGVTYRSKEAHHRLQRST